MINLSDKTSENKFEFVIIFNDFSNICIYEYLFQFHTSYIYKTIEIKFRGDYKCLSSKKWESTFKINLGKLHKKFRFEEILY